MGVETDADSCSGEDAGAAAASGGAGAAAGAGGLGMFETLPPKKLMIKVTFAHQTNGSLSLVALPRDRETSMLSVHRCGLGQIRRLPVRVELTESLPWVGPRHIGRILKTFQR